MKNWLYTHFKNGKFQKDGDYLCSSPFREDKHPSFSISPEKRCWHDFGTGESGKLSELCSTLGIEEPPREGGAYAPPPPSRTGPSEAEVFWNSSSTANPKHPYLVRKRLPADGLRQNGKYLIVPCRTLDGRLTGCEKIPPEENANPKRLQVGPKKGAFFFYGSPADGQGIVLCEGLATALSVFQTSGITSATTYSAVFLENGVRLIKAKFPNSEIIVAADADEEGQKAAEQCRALGCTVVEHAQDAPKGWDWNDAVLEDFDQAREQFRSALKAGRAARIEPEILEVEPEPEQPREEEKSSSFKLIRADELELTEPEFLVGGVLERDSLGAIFGESGSAKTFFCLDMLCSISTGCTFHGRQVEEAPTVYLCGEGRRAIKRRLTAWEKGRGVSLEGAPLYVSSRAAVLPDERMQVELMTAVDDIVQTTGRTPGIIAFDTLARSLNGDENSNTDMGLFIRACDMLRTRYPGVTVLLVHHSGHAEGNRMRGASALKGALDMEMRVAKDGSHVTVSCTKPKDSEPFDDMHFVLKVQGVGQTIGGEDITSCYLEEMEEAPARVGKPLSDVLHLALQSFHKAAEHAGTLDDEGKFLGVHLDAWRRFYYESSTADNQEAKKVAFQRHRAALVKAGALAVANDVYTLAGDLAEIQGNEYAKKLKKLNRNTEQERNIPEQCSAGETT